MRTLLLVCVACLSLFGQTAQEPPNSKEAARKEKGQVAADKKEHQGLPPDTLLSKAQLNNADEGEKAKNKNDKGESYPQPDWWIISLTGGLVLVGAGQAWVLIRQTDIIEQSLLLTQRPRLTIRNLVINEPIRSIRYLSFVSKEGIFKPDDPIRGNLALVNQGSGTATIVGSGVCIFHKTHRSGPENTVDLIAVGERLRAGERRGCIFSGTGPSRDQYIYWQKNPKTAPLVLYVAGWVEYRDKLGIVRRSGFLRRYWTGEKSFIDRFVPVKDPDYEYSD